MKRVLAAIILFVLCYGVSLSKDLPPLKGMVNDYAGLLSPQEEKIVETLLKDTEDKTSSQVVLLTVRSLEGESLEDFSMRVAESWAIGQKGLDNGVLLLVALQERKVRIEVGYGLESILTDIKCGFIIREFIVSRFKQGNYFAGIHKGLEAITGVVRKDFDIRPEELERYKRSRQKSKTSQIPIGLIIFILIILANFLRGGGGRGRPSIFFGGGFGRGGGGWSSGGGFSGGGGGFGGGGASGGW